jgi:hypothetical protein
MAGQGSVLGERHAQMPARLLSLLHAGTGTQWPFGQREACLFEPEAAAAYVQEIAELCVAAVDEDFADEGNWSDLCREGLGIGMLAALSVLEPCRVPIGKIELWRRAAQDGLVTLEAEPDEELDFHRGYYAKLDGLLAFLLQRFS